MVLPERLPRQPKIYPASARPGPVSPPESLRSIGGGPLEPNPGCPISLRVLGNLNFPPKELP